LKRSWDKELLSVVRHMAFVILVLIGVLFFRQMGQPYSRLSVLYYAVLGTVMIFISRIIWKKLLLMRLKRGENVRKVLIVTDSASAEETIRRMRKNISPDISLIGIVLLDDAGAAEEIEGLKIFCRPGQIIDKLQGAWVDEVMICPSGENRVPEELLGKLAEMGVTTHLKIGVDHERSTMQTIERVAGITVLTESIRIASPGQILVKRALDIIGGLVGLFFTAILTVIVGPLIYFADPGPIFFRQKRVGKNGRIFKIWKFRSMYQDAEARKKELMDRNEMDGLMFKMEADPRVIGSGPDGTRHGIGWFIRKTSIDEFPQFLNVLVGDMSLVGTRPPTLDEWRNYDPHHRARMAIKPGLTGLWQVSGRSNITDFEEVIKLDLEYINTWSVAGDVAIILKTVKVLFTGDGAK
jgi:exopolysaccharide biosynthesis polyprenyl glycosylphosphotransferase